MISLKSLLLCLLIFIIPALSAERYWVYFTDKGDFETMSFQEQIDLVKAQLSESAWKRRLAQTGNSALEKIIREDLPIYPPYLQKLTEMGFQVRHRIRWMNAISGTIEATRLEQIQALPFVREIRPVRSFKTAKKADFREAPSSFNRITSPDTLILDYGASGGQADFHKYNQLHLKGLTGKDVIVAIFDTGFDLSHPALQMVKSNLLGEYDFVQDDSVTANQPGDDSTQDQHGTYTLSVLGGLAQHFLVGPAFEAKFILAKTEKVDQEIHQEEDNWAAAAQWAEALGAQIVSSSLGYSEFDAGQGSYNYQDMDGETTIVTRAANFLAERGVLVVNSAGNEGRSAWYYITAPADGKKVLTVGALTIDNQVATFSSHGPTADGRIKPDVAALGVGVYGTRSGGGYQTASGTSAACPLVAGIAAQLLQARPDLNYQQLIHILRQSGDNSASPNNDRGWGKVDAYVAWQKLQQIEPPEVVKFIHPRPNPLTGFGNPIYFPVQLPQNGIIEIEIFNILGQKITTIRQAGIAAENLVSWNTQNSRGNRVPSGVFVYRIRALGKTSTGKLVISY